MANFVSLKMKKKLNHIYQETQMLWTKIKDIFTGKDKNWDGKVDIHDKMIEAEEKVNANKKGKRRVENK